MNLEYTISTTRLNKKILLGLDLFKLALYQGLGAYSGSSRGQGNFRGPKASRPRPGTGGFEAKAKDLKMCPRGQERPRGLHL